MSTTGTVPTLGSVRSVSELILLLLHSSPEETARAAKLLVQALAFADAAQAKVLSCWCPLETPRLRGLRGPIAAGLPLPRLPASTYSNDSLHTELLSAVFVPPLVRTPHNEEVRRHCPMRCNADVSARCH